MHGSTVRSCSGAMQPCHPASLLLWIGVVLPLAAPAHAFSRGASPASCREMSPGHIRAQPQDPHHSFVILRTSASTYLPGQLVTVTVRSSRDFMGFLLQARSAGESDAGLGVRGGRAAVRGSWAVAPPGTHTLRCLSEGDTITHSDKQLKRNLSFVWRAPDRPLGDVRFYITVVQSYFVYWAGIKSAVVHDGSRSSTNQRSATALNKVKSRSETREEEFSASQALRAQIITTEQTGSETDGPAVTLGPPPLTVNHMKSHTALGLPKRDLNAGSKMDYFTTGLLKHSGSDPAKRTTQGPLTVTLQTGIETDSYLSSGPLTEAPRLNGRHTHDFVTSRAMITISRTGTDVDTSTLSGPMNEVRWTDVGDKGTLTKQTGSATERYTPSAPRVAVTGQATESSVTRPAGLATSTPSALSPEKGEDHEGGAGETGSQNSSGQNSSLSLSLVPLKDGAVDEGGAEAGREIVGLLRDSEPGGWAFPSGTTAPKPAAGTPSTREELGQHRSDSQTKTEMTTQGTGDHHSTLAKAPTVLMNTEMYQFATSSLQPMIQAQTSLRLANPNQQQASLAFTHSHRPQTGTLKPQSRALKPPQPQANWAQNDSTRDHDLTAGVNASSLSWSSLSPVRGQLRTSKYQIKTSPGDLLQPEPPERTVPPFKPLEHGLPNPTQSQRQPPSPASSRKSDSAPQDAIHSLRSPEPMRGMNLEVAPARTSPLPRSTSTPPPFSSSTFSPSSWLHSSSPLSPSLYPYLTSALPSPASLLSFQSSSLSPDPPETIPSHPPLPPPFPLSIPPRSPLSSSSSPFSIPLFSSPSNSSPPPRDPSPAPLHLLSQRPTPVPASPHPAPTPAQRSPNQDPIPLSSEADPRRGSPETGSGLNLRPTHDLEPNPDHLDIESKAPKVKPKPADSPGVGGKTPDPNPRHSAWELGMLLGCAAGLGMVVVVGVHYVYRQSCGKQTEVRLNEREREYERGDRGLIHVQECGDLVRVRRIRENSFMVLAEYDILTPPGD